MAAQRIDVANLFRRSPAPFPLKRGKKVPQNPTLSESYTHNRETLIFHPRLIDLNPLTHVQLPSLAAVLPGFMTSASVGQPW